jgi:hypothetical protein
MENFVIHIFGYGETQLITNQNSLKYESKNLTKVQPLVDAVWDLKPVDFVGEKEYHVINFFDKKDVRWVSENYFNVKDNESLIPLIEELIIEIQEYKSN